MIQLQALLKDTSVTREMLEEAGLRRPLAKRKKNGDRDLVASEPCECRKGFE